MSNGIFDTRIKSMGIVDEKGDHVYVAVPGGIYETTDAAETWTLVNNSHRFGTCYSFKNGTILGEEYIFASCDIGIINIPVKGGEWNVIPPGGWGRAGYLTVSDSLENTSVLGGCLGGHVFIGTVINTTAANWTSFTDRPCTMLALNPNNKDHFIYTKPPLTYQSTDGGKTYESLNHSNIFHCGIDRVGNLYTAAMGGAFISRDCGPGPNMKRPCSWQGLYDKRVQRRTNRTTVRGAHDYQRISLDFGGSVSFSSDQGLFIKTKDDNLELIKANGNLSNNIALKASISEGDGPGKNYIVTAVWDWAPLASWDSGAHWPSWQTADDGASGTCIGEGGGSYGMGKSNHMLLMHHHNILASTRGGKNLSRFVVPHGATVFGPTYSMLPGTQTAEPNGAVYAPLFMGGMPWDTVADKIFACNGTEFVADIGLHTNYSCIATVDIGTTYGWYPGVNYAVWRGDSDKHCHICKIPGNSTNWELKNETGVFSFVKQQAKADRDIKKMMDLLDSDGDGRIDDHDLVASMSKPDNSFAEEDPDDPDDGDDDDGEDYCDSDEECSDIDGGKDEDDSTGILIGSTLYMSSDIPKSTGGKEWIIKNFNYGQGMNWTWTPIPDHMAGTNAFTTDPTNASTIYGIAPNCISRSYDQGDTWLPCWNASDGSFKGPFSGLVIKDSKTMIAMRSGAVPLRTKDGGNTWHELESCSIISTFSMGALYSWSGKTLALLGHGGSQSPSHPHAGFVWRSTDDGDTWTDETGDLVTMAVGAAQWYEEKLYLNTMGQGILYKTFEW